MCEQVYRYEFDSGVNAEEVEASLVLALISTESLHGETATQLGTSHYFDAEQRVCVVDACSEAGRDFNSLFAGFLRREFGPSSFHVRRVRAVDETMAPSAV